ncbi:cytochrome P450 [Streptomyces sp. S1D4-20]|uniref:cytochrome P450 n=1 Tax=Streptomyces sp. S1D4-20 TaxID=2594462 RepID=UPI0019687874|nr:cytochrome P450 [Streptomyces sp. S1D4-20]
MTTPHPMPGALPPNGGCPHGPASSTTVPAGHLAIHGPEFSANPHAIYNQLRALGPIAPCEIAPGVYGYVTTTYRSALYLLRNTPEVFAKDPRHWLALRDGHVPADSPAREMMQPRQSALWLDGEDHGRLRGAITDSLGWVDTHALAATVARIADQLLDRISTRGRADLVAHFADPLPMQVLIEMFGCPSDLGQVIVNSVAKLFDTTQDSARTNADLESACLAVARLKRDQPAADVASWLVHHPARLSDDEIVQQILLVVGAGTVPSTNLIANSLLLLITDDQYSGDLHTGVRPVADALDHVLWEDPPVSNYCPLYARYQHTYEGIRLPAGVPILVSFAAANSDPALGKHSQRRAGNRAHLAFSAGIRSCPAPGLARVITETAIERVLDRLPDLALEVPVSRLTRRPGTFHSGWTNLPVTFPAAAPSATHSYGVSR